MVTELYKYADNPEECHYASIKRVVRYLGKTYKLGIIWWKKETKMNIPVGRIIPKMSTDTKVPGATSSYEAVNYIVASHAKCLRSRTYVGSFVITIFVVAAYQQSKLQSTVVTSSTEAEFIDAVSGDKYEIYISSVIEDIVFSRKGPTKYFCDNTEAIYMQKYKKPKDMVIHIDVKNFYLQE